MSDREHYVAMTVAGIVALFMIGRSLIEANGPFDWFELVFWTVVGFAWVVVGLRGLRNGTRRSA